MSANTSAPHTWLHPAGAYLPRCGQGFRINSRLTTAKASLGVESQAKCNFAKSARAQFETRCGAAPNSTGTPMSHGSQVKYVRKLQETLGPFFTDQRVLEVGSLDINGSVRQFFSGGSYVGLDVAAGPGVDVVCQGQEYAAPDGSYDVVISCEAMEHNPHWVGTMENMIRVCRPGGLVVMTCATVGRPEHGTARTDPHASPLTVQLGWNYYRNLRVKDFEQAIDFKSQFSAYRFWVNWNHYDVLFAGIKGPGEMSLDLASRWVDSTAALDRWHAEESGLLTHRYRAAAAALFGDRWFVAMQRLSRQLEWLNAPHG